MIEEPYQTERSYIFFVKPWILFRDWHQCSWVLINAKNNIFEEREIVESWKFGPQFDLWLFEFFTFI